MQNKGLVITLAVCLALVSAFYRPGFLHSKLLVCDNALRQEGCGIRSG